LLHTPQFSPHSSHQLIYVYYEWMYVFFWKDDRRADNSVEWLEKFEVCSKALGAWNHYIRNRKYYGGPEPEGPDKFCIDLTRDGSVYTKCCEIVDKIRISDSNGTLHDLPSRWENYDFHRERALGKIRIWHFVLGAVSVALGIFFGWIVLYFIRKLRRPSGPNEMKPIEELESWAATRRAREKKKILESSDDETDSISWLHLRLMAMRSKTEKLAALSQTLKETNDILTSDFVDLILSAFPEEEEAMEAFVIIEPYFESEIQHLTLRDTLDVVVED